MLENRLVHEGIRRIVFSQEFCKLRVNLFLAMNDLTVRLSVVELSAMPSDMHSDMQCGANLAMSVEFSITERTSRAYVPKMLHIMSVYH